MSGKNGISDKYYRRYNKYIIKSKYNGLYSNNNNGSNRLYVKYFSKNII